MWPRLALIAFFSTTLFSCSSHTFDDVVEPEVIEPELVTYQDIKFVFENICTECHSNPPQNGAPMPLVTFDNAREAVLNRGLLDRISRAEGSNGLMPLGGPRLPQGTIDMMVQWNEDGLLEN
ncbi:MAG: hypothetical protein AAF489_16540 [Bacteroidota bacterium]